MTTPPSSLPPLDPSIWFGVDIDVSSTDGDMSIATNYDLALVAGDGATQQEAYLRAIDNPQDYLFINDWGAGLMAYVGQPFTETAQAALADLLSAQAAQVQGVQQVLGVILTEEGQDFFRIVVTLLRGGAVVQLPLSVSALGVVVE
jgi:hypothetical protein